MGRYSLRDYRMSRRPPKSLKRSICRDLSPERENDVLVQDAVELGLSVVVTNASADQHVCADRKANPAVTDVVTVDHQDRERPIPAADPSIKGAIRTRVRPAVDLDVAAVLMQLGVHHHKRCAEVRWVPAVETEVPARASGIVRSDRGEERFKSRSRRALCSGNRRAGNAPILRIRGSRSETGPGESGDEDAQRGGVPPIKGENEAPHLAYLSQNGPS